MASSNSSTSQPAPGTSSAQASPSPSRKSSVSNARAGKQHAPTNPSNLRLSHTASSSEDHKSDAASSNTAEEQEDLSRPVSPKDVLYFHRDGIHPAARDSASAYSDTSATRIAGQLHDGLEPNARKRLLEQHNWDGSSGCREDNYNYGPLSPRSTFNRDYGRVVSIDSQDGFGRRYEDSVRDGIGYSRDHVHGLLGDAIADGTLGEGRSHKMSTTQWLAHRHGVRNIRVMYLLYYLPVTRWVPQYRLSYLRGDLIAALTMASFYIPMSLSYASNLGHIPPINGLYSFVFNPLLYAVFGTCPQMVVGPEAAGSLLIGQVVRESINNGHHHDSDDTKNAQIAGMVTGLAGLVIFVAGLARLGFLDGVLSRPFLRGFISAIGIVILVDQLIPEMGLDRVAAHVGGAAHGSSLDKIIFLVRNMDRAHGLTCAVSFGSFAIIMVLRELKRRLQPRFTWVAYVPDRFLVVVLSAVFTWSSSWDRKGLEILGEIRAKGKPFQAHFPFQPSMLSEATNTFSTAFLIALLGFFESSVAAKSLKAGTVKVKRKKDDEEGDEEVEEAIKGMTVSANRELVALGVANLIGGLFMALPAFGGYGRSKVNASTGGRTPMSSVFLSLISVVCVLFLLPYFYYIPKGVLSAMISVVAYSLIEEAPQDIRFFYRISGYYELLLMFLIFLTTFFWNLRIGIAAGIGFSLIRLLKHATRPRIQILGRRPGTTEFENAELVGENLEFLPGCLVVKIPEPLTFANTGSLKDRLRRLEDHGTGAAHPALPRVRREEHNRNVIFDIHGVTGLDPAAAQVLLEIVSGYRERGTQVYFSRVPSRRGEVWRLMCVSGIVDKIGGERHCVSNVQDALDLADEEQRLDEDGYRDDVDE
ncbi:hypothetical protein LTR66_007319 [Elasticomyces elasticus]|nr:hypothetical protein LTR66_007319 [Elasticomyces elasticus]